jgi:MarR family transcriptional regulator for hemolysin
MNKLPIERDIAFNIKDVARMLSTYADQRGRQLGISQAQWSVLVRLQRQEGQKQSELAEMLDLQPISLTRLLDRLAQNGLIERRPDPHDRRANRLYLTPAARPLLEQLGYLGQDVMEGVLAGIDPSGREQFLRNLLLMKDNLRSAINRNPNNTQQSALVESL